MHALHLLCGPSEQSLAWLLWQRCATCIYGDALFRRRDLYDTVSGQPSTASTFWLVHCLKVAMAHGGGGGGGGVRIMGVWYWIPNVMSLASRNAAYLTFQTVQATREFAVGGAKSMPGLIWPNLIVLAHVKSKVSSQ